jgi:hypothetical protein
MYKSTKKGFFILRKGGRFFFEIFNFWGPKIFKKRKKFVLDFCQKNFKIRSPKNENRQKKPPCLTQNFSSKFLSFVYFVLFIDSFYKHF